MVSIYASRYNASAEQEQYKSGSRALSHGKGDGTYLECKILGCDDTCDCKAMETRKQHFTVLL
jgi:hypothetical protein